MPKFIIEREIPNAGALCAADLKAIAKKSCAVLRELGLDPDLHEAVLESVGTS